jgi:hypothetical protein
MVASLVDRAFRSGVPTAIVIVLWAVAPTDGAQERPRAGTSDVPVPRVQMVVAPVYPAIALLDQPRWVVKVDALVGADGHVENVRSIDPQPQDSAPAAADRRSSDPTAEEVNRSVQDAVRQWVFAPPMVNGRAAPVIVPITVRFEVFSPPAVSFFSEPLPVSEMPSDFSMLYTQGICTLDTRAGVFSVAPIGTAPAESRPLVLAGNELDSIYQEMRRVRLFEYPTAIYAGYERGPSSQRDATWAISGEGVLMVMRLENSGPMIREPSAIHQFDVRQNGKISTVTWDDTYSGTPITREIEGIRAVINVVKRVLDHHQELRDLQAVAQDCRRVSRSDFQP